MAIQFFNTVGIDEFIIHNGDITTKFGFVANNNFAINTAGTERVRVTSGGSVGINTNNPGAKLDVEGNAVIGAAGNIVSGDFAVAINKNTVVTSEDGFAQGENTIANGRQAAAFGFNTYANGGASIAGGALSESNGQRSIAVGATAISNGDDSAAFNVGTRANGEFSFATGQGCFATGNASFATGSNTQATALYSFSGGVNSIASGNGAVALGGGAQCSGEFSFAAGNINVASGLNTTALGFDNDAIGNHSAVIGHLNTTAAGGVYGVAINFQNTVSGQGGFAFNQGNTVSGLNAASGGVSNTVTAEASFAYGYGNDTSGGGSTPPQQILLGRFLQPPRDVAGNAGEAQVIVGRYNEHANQSATAFAVGTGTASNATRSSLKVYYDNTVSLADNVTVRSTNSYFSNPIRIGADATTNELDDYEEGTFNQTFYILTMGGATAYDISDFGSGSETSKYVKIGRLVMCNVYITFATRPTAWATSGSMENLAFGLPFTSIDGIAHGSWGAFGSDSAINSHNLQSYKYSYFNTLAFESTRSSSGNDFFPIYPYEFLTNVPAGTRTLRMSYSFYTTD
ncbi:MAG: hypothetical protein GY787_16555 [Alteromonadales bacterium]|nr:hypothetical protein [Alteromonadales bacterium]